MYNRNLYLKTISVEEALDKYLNKLNEKNIFCDTVEEVETANSFNRVTSQAVFAKCNSPLFTASAMDGICVNSKITKGASEENPIILKKNIDFKIVDTGDVVKSPYDAVIMAEDIIIIDDDTVKIINPVSSFENVRPIGEDIVKNEMVIPSNHLITPIDIGALIASGNLNIKCIKKISVGVIPTGDEIIDPRTNPSVGDIIDSNSYMIKSLINSLNANAYRYDIVKDNYKCRFKCRNRRLYSTCFKRIR